MMLRGETSPPGDKEITFTVEDSDGVSSFSIKHFDIVFMLLSVFSMFRGITSSCDYCYPKSLHGYLKSYLSFSFLLLTTLFIATVLSQMLLIAAILTTIGVNYAVCFHAIKPFPPSLLVTPILSLIFPICSLPSAQFHATVGQKKSYFDRLSFLRIWFTFFLLYVCV
jgi:hypothetical protein